MSNTDDNNTKNYSNLDRKLFYFVVSGMTAAVCTTSPPTPPTPCPHHPPAPSTAGEKKLKKKQFKMWVFKIFERHA